jgi:hypothetical protein
MERRVMGKERVEADGVAQGFLCSLGGRRGQPVSPRGIYGYKRWSFRARLFVAGRPVLRSAEN